MNTTGNQFKVAGRSLVRLGLLGALLAYGCSDDGESTPDQGVADGPSHDVGLFDAPKPNDLEADGGFVCTTRTQKLTDVNDWLYQLADLDLDAVGKSKYDLVVMDAFASGHTIHTREDIEKLKCSSGGDKFVVSYVNIGQAENYRYYWQSGWKIGSPTWIYEADPDWAGDFWVRFWVKEWQDIIFGSPNSYIDRVIEAGFDGVYLDRIDDYELFLTERPTVIDDMKKFVKDISDYARKKDPNFIVFVQNSEELAEEPNWLDPITGIGKEEPFYWAHDTPVNAGERQELDHLLGLFLTAGKMVLTVDYALQTANINDAYTKAKAKGYISYVTDNALDKLTINPGNEPD